MSKLLSVSYYKEINMSNSIVKKKESTKPKFRSIQELYRDQAAYARFQNMVDEAVTCKSKIQMEQQNIKVLREAAAELGVKPAIFNANVAMVFNNDYAQRKDNLDQQLELVERAMADAGLIAVGDTTGTDDNDE